MDEYISYFLGLRKPYPQVWCFEMVSALNSRELESLPSCLRLSCWSAGKALSDQGNFSVRQGNALKTPPSEAHQIMRKVQTGVSESSGRVDRLSIDCSEVSPRGFLGRLHLHRTASPLWRSGPLLPWTCAAANPSAARSLIQATVCYSP